MNKSSPNVAKTLPGFFYPGRVAVKPLKDQGLLSITPTFSKEIRN